MRTLPKLTGIDRYLPFPSISVMVFLRAVEQNLKQIDKSFQLLGVKEL